MSDVDPARADVPGGDVGPLYRSIWRLLDLPLLLYHDCKAPEREDYVWETTIAARCEGNVQDGWTRTHSSRCARLMMPPWRYCT